MCEAQRSQTLRATRGCRPLESRLRPLVLSLCAVSFLGLGLTGCGDKKEGDVAPAASASAPRDTLNFGSMKDIRDINPHLYLGEMAAQGMVFEALTKNTKEGVS